MGECYFRGWGAPQNFGRARELLEKVKGENPKVFFMLGYLYGRGIGVSTDIQKAVRYLQGGQKTIRRQKKNCSGIKRHCQKSGKCGRMDHKQIAADTGGKDEIQT